MSPSNNNSGPHGPAHRDPIIVRTAPLQRRLEAWPESKHKKAQEERSSSTNCGACVLVASSLVCVSIPKNRGGCFDDHHTPAFPCALPLCFLRLRRVCFTFFANSLVHVKSVQRKGLGKGKKEWERRSFACCLRRAWLGSSSLHTPRRAACFPWQIACFDGLKEE